MYGSGKKVKIELIKGTNLVLVTLIMKMENVTENVIEILRKIKWLKSEYSKKKLSKACETLEVISEKPNVLKLVSTKSHEIWDWVRLYDIAKRDKTGICR